MKTKTVYVEWNRLYNRTAFKAEKPWTRWLITYEGDKLLKIKYMWDLDPRIITEFKKKDSKDILNTLNIK